MRDQRTKAVIGRVLLCGAVLAAATAGCAGSQDVPVPAPAPASSAPVPTTAGAVGVDPNAPEVNAAGDIPDNQVFIPYSPPDGLFTVSVPEGWARRADGDATVFTDKFNSVRVEVVPRATAPEVASATAEELPALQRAVAGFAPGDVVVVTRKAGRGVLITYTARSAPDPVTGRSAVEAVERYEFWKDGHEAVLTLSGPKGADNVDPWRTVSDSFGWRR